MKKEKFQLYVSTAISGIFITMFISSLVTYLALTDLSIFFDAANIWGVDYDSSLSDGSKIRSSIGFTLYWSTPIGPLQFNWAKPQQYESGIDKTENFSFNIASQF